MTGRCSTCGLRKPSVRSTCEHWRAAWVDGERAGTLRYAPHCADPKCADLFCVSPWKVTVDRQTWRTYSPADAAFDLVDHGASVRFA